MGIDVACDCVMRDAAAFWSAAVFCRFGSWLSKSGGAPPHSKTPAAFRTSLEFVDMV